MASRTTRLRWFDKGAEAFARSCPGGLALLPKGIGPVYVCPCCVTRTSFTAFQRGAIRQELLTEEHAPLRSFGGRALTLTCKGCNSWAGSYLDAEARKAANPVAALSGQINGPHPVRFEVDGRPVNAWLSGNVRDGIRVEVPLAHNRPSDHQAFVETSDRLAHERRTDFSIHMTFARDQYNRERANASWLRAAYIVLFAKFGYRLVLNKAYRVVREQIAAPKSALIKDYLFTDHRQSSQARAILHVRTPQDVRGIVVRMGHRHVWLPDPDDTTFFDRLSALKRRDRRVPVGECMEAPWPRGSEFLADFHG